MAGSSRIASYADPADEALPTLFASKYEDNKGARQRRAPSCRRRCYLSARQTHIKEVGGPAERRDISDNDALTMMAALVVPRRADAAARELGYAAPSAWCEIADRLKLPMRADGVIAAHDQ